uniref:Aspartyl/asparaginy/proline hydroxylase domain-containing protein n=1 Tax=Globodera rostochiensis TaxID=31243 RepID=A0A914HXV3_GLORO
MLTVLLAICLSLGPVLAYLSIAIFSHRFLTADRSRNRPICTSPGCVRCNRNANELASALDRFQKCRFSARVQFARVHRALERAHCASAGDAHALFFRMEFDGAQRPIWTRAQLPREFVAKIALLERQHAAIAEECENALLNCTHLWCRNDEKPSPTHSGSTASTSSSSAPSSAWFTFSLINQGDWRERQCRECPRITALLHQMADDNGNVGTGNDGESSDSSASLLTECLFGNAFISLLPAGAAIAEHRGLTNARLRVHFGVRVPEGKSAERCFMTVGGEKFHWSAATAVVIDDSFPHSVNSRDCSEDRLVLVLDFWHPNLRHQERHCLQRIFPPICVP